MGGIKIPNPYEVKGDIGSYVRDRGGSTDFGIGSAATFRNINNLLGISDMDAAKMILDPGGLILQSEGERARELQGYADVGGIGIDKSLQAEAAAEQQQRMLDELGKALGPRPEISDTGASIAMPSKTLGEDDEETRRTALTRKRLGTKQLQIPLASTSSPASTGMSTAGGIAFGLKV